MGHTTAPSAKQFGWQRRKAFLSAGSLPVLFKLQLRTPHCLLGREGFDHWTSKGFLSITIITNTLKRTKAVPSADGAPSEVEGAIANAKQMKIARA